MNYASIFVLCGLLFYMSSATNTVTLCDTYTLTTTDPNQPSGTVTATCSSGTPHATCASGGTTNIQLSGCQPPPTVAACPTSNDYSCQITSGIVTCTIPSSSTTRWRTCSGGATSSWQDGVIVCNTYLVTSTDFNQPSGTVTATCSSGTPHTTCASGTNTNIQLSGCQPPSTTTVCPASNVYSCQITSGIIVTCTSSYSSTTSAALTCSGGATASWETSTYSPLIFKSSAPKKLLINIIYLFPVVLFSSVLATFFFFFE